MQFSALSARLMVAAWGVVAVPAYAQRPPRSVGSMPATRALPGPICVGDYADDLSALVSRVREYERQPYSYCVRNTASYECLSYAPDGSLRRTRKRAVMHGTAFGYRQQNGETLMATNQHVAEWPAVTDEEHPVEGVPIGCKKLGDQLSIVESESDAYERDNVQLQRVAADSQLDIAVLRAHKLLPILPWKIGRSASLRERNVVEVRGFPLGAFQATSVGKVISAFDHDGYKDWDHDDFVVDALLSSGNSGSPVLAVSCRTGEFELVGIYHAGYAEGSALNVVVGIDQIRDFLTTFKRAPRFRANASDGVPLDARDRARLGDPRAPDSYFPFGALTASVQRRSDGAFLFQLLSRDFPLRVHPILVLEDLPSPEPKEFGELGRVWFGAPSGLRSYARGDLDAEAQAQITHLLEQLRRDALAAFAYRSAARDGGQSRERFDHMTRLERALKRATAQHKDAALAAGELAERLGPHGADAPLPFAEIFVVPAPGVPPDKPVVGKKP